MSRNSVLELGGTWSAVFNLKPSNRESNICPFILEEIITSFVNNAIENNKRVH